MTETRLGVLVSVAAIITACDQPIPEWCFPSDAPTQVVTVAGDDLSPTAITEVWSVGGLTENQEFLFPNAISIDRRSGTIAVSDRRLGSIALISGTGEWIGRLAKPGQGPGEFLAPIALTWTSTGDLSILDAGNSKLLALRTDGTVVEEALIDPQFIASLLGSGMMWAFLHNGDIIGQPAPRVIQGSAEAEFVILRARDNGAHVDTVLSSIVRTFEPRGLTPVAIPGQAVPLAAPLVDGLLAVAGDIPEYRIRVIDQTGDLVRQICWETEPVEFSPQEISGMENVAIPGFQDDLQRVRPTGTLARVGRLLGDPAGNTWVQRERASPLNVLDRFLGPPGASFDVLDANGNYLRSIHAPDRVRIAAIGDGLIIGVRTGDLDEISVVGYRLAEPRQ